METVATLAALAPHTGVKWYNPMTCRILQTWRVKKSFAIPGPYVPVLFDQSSEGRKGDFDDFGAAHHFGLAWAWVLSKRLQPLNTSVSVQFQR